MPKVIRARCSLCGYTAAYSGRTIDEVRLIVCPGCAAQGKQNRLTVYGTEESGQTTPALPAKAGTSAPGIERVAMSDAYRKIVNDTTRRLLVDAFGEEEDA